jgi:beta-phosphoglucomutase
MEITSCIFDVDGVLLASPHERAWREALEGFADPTRFTTAIYQAQVAGKPRAAGALAALEAMGVADAAAQATRYAEIKQKRLEALVRDGKVEAFPDALRFVDAVAALGRPMAVASSSKNANAMMGPIRLPSGRALLDVFAVNARELRVEPTHCVVFEDAPSGIEAARAGNMAGVGIARFDDAASLSSAGAQLVVTTLDDVSTDALAQGRIERRSA